MTQVSNKINPLSRLAIANGDIISRECRLEEYRALRAEILSQFQNRNNVLTLGSATLGILFNVAATVGKDIKSPRSDLENLEITASVIVLTITVPLLTSLIIFLWGVYTSRVTMIGKYLWDKENEDKVLGINTFKWEHYLRKSKDSDEIRQSMAVTVIFTAIALTSVVFGIRIGSLVQPNGFILCQIFPWLFLLAGFLSGDYRMYKIDQGFAHDISQLSKFPFYLLRKILFPIGIIYIGLKALRKSRQR